MYIPWNVCFYINSTFMFVHQQEYLLLYSHHKFHLYYMYPRMHYLARPWHHILHSGSSASPAALFFYNTDTATSPRDSGFLDSVTFIIWKCRNFPSCSTRSTRHRYTSLVTRLHGHSQSSCDTVNVCHMT